MSDKQSDLLRDLSRRTEPVPEDHLDGRVVRALESRRFVERQDGRVVLTDAGRDHFQSHVRRRRRGRTLAAEQDPRTARADAVRRAIEILELAIPGEYAMRVGDLDATGEELLEGLRRFAGQMAGGDPVPES
ncbi:MAG TPA: hypothetical protein VGR37_17000 [Longimicrobiaceae bacterium]|nr:hypothetical protein [Longimicrobiaceae bacterium]